MRLKHIHIAGFKSFVDPVTIPATAQLTGVVGPNGCGKSNVIDAVRWVLGESKARELRGASLQDVIFNGSAGRRPASRAAVELLFDNGAGRAAGPWAQYAEIAVKRVLTRAGESSYWINNVQVRKKDMMELFLGTGLAGDAYAIIEQGMISRIIDARPDELRGFLEEAAGVSRYKERRRETEARLRDTRDNLARVSDIRAELAQQLEKLGAQAEVTRRFIALEQQRSLTTHWLALVRRRAAQARQAELERQLAGAQNEIEARLAELRRIEAGLEQQRLLQFEATEALNQAQAGFYAASAEVARVEQELKHLDATRERLRQALQANDAQQAAAGSELAAIRDEMAMLEEALAQAQIQAEMLQDRAATAGDALPAADAAWRTAQAEVAAVQRELAAAEQAVQLEEAHRAHAERAIDQLKARERRLMQERDSLEAQDEAHTARLEMELEALEERAANLADYLEQDRAALPGLEQELRQSRQALDDARGGQHRLEAQLAALHQLQDEARRADGQGAAWLAEAGLADARRLWQNLRVEAGWETAIEAALGEGMAALAVEAASEWLTQPPSLRIELLLPGVAPAGAPASAPVPAGEGGGGPIARLIHTDDPRTAQYLADRLALAYAADSLEQALTWRHRLPPGGFIATREGHRVGREGIVFNAPAQAQQGVIARMREIEALQAAVEAGRARLDEVNEAVARAEDALHARRRQVDALQAQIGQHQTQAGPLRAQLARAQEAARRVAERRAQVLHDLDELYVHLSAQEDAWNDAGANQMAAEAGIAAARARLEQARQTRHTLDVQLQSLREAQRRTEREAQEAAFQVRALHNRLHELSERATRDEQALHRLAQAHARLAAELAATEAAPLQERLHALLAARHAAEARLSQTRDALEAANQALRTLEGARMHTERALQPVQERVQALTLSMQEARLNEARFVEALAGIDEARLVDGAGQAGLVGRGESWLKAELEGVEAQIAALGPVNMAALDELETAQARKEYLDAQASDLDTAADTLEEAIRRIDAETRARLKETYDQVRVAFQALFQELFGGGQAELRLTGEELLDAGLTVMAQPPGKKNSSIQLLSGGEKALTALSLVFAFFRLNPAPFCLLDEVDAPLDDSNTERYCNMVTKMSAETQFLFITHNRLTMQMAHHLVGVTMPEPGVSRAVAVDVDDALRLAAP